jgi:hypothetical protein
MAVELLRDERRRRLTNLNGRADNSLHRDGEYHAREADPT